MNYITYIISSDRFLIILELALIVIFITVGIVAIRKRSGILNRRKVRSIQQRNQELDERLANPLRYKQDSSSKLTPFEEKYSPESNKGTAVDGGVTIEIRVGSPTSTRKYLTDVTGTLSIGSDGGNDLVIDSRKVAKKQCVLFINDGELYIRNLTKDMSVIAERSHTKKNVTDTPLKVQSNDKYYMADITMEIQIH